MNAMNRVRIKLCGMTRVEDAVLAATLGADAIGLVFALDSPRRLSCAQARSIRDALPPLVASVALFRDQDAPRVREVIAAVQPDLLQFHGSEDDAWCAQFGRAWFKAIPMGDGAAALPQLARYPSADGLLLDAHTSGTAGGRGRAFDWSLVPQDLPQPVLLAGGLNPDNVAEAIRIARPWAVDVASGVESAPGIKDAVKMRRFIAAVRDSAAAIPE